MERLIRCIFEVNGFSTPMDIWFVFGGVSSGERGCFLVLFSFTGFLIVTKTDCSSSLFGVKKNGVCFLVNE